MVKIVVVCAAGASSTFLVRRLSALASSAGLEWEVTPSSSEEIRVAPDHVVAVNFHVATPDLCDAVAAQGARVVVLPEGVTGGIGAESALETIHKFLQENQGHSDSTVESSPVGSSRS
jgi:PTS system cellobiose-specific IIB component